MVVVWILIELGASQTFSSADETNEVIVVNDNNLKFSSHILTMSNKISKAAGVIFKVFKNVSKFHSSHTSIVNGSSDAGNLYVFLGKFNRIPVALIMLLFQCIIPICSV